MKTETRFKPTEIGMIPEDWEVEKIDNLYDISSGLSKPRNEFGFGYPFLSFKNIFDNFSLPEELHELVNSTEKERKDCSITRGDVFLTRTSETIGELGMSSVALKNYENATFNGFAKRLRPKRKDIILPEFAVYLFRSSKIRSQILTFSSLTTRASLNAGMIKEIKVIIPSPPEQSAIVNILSPLDNRIDLNRQTNATLEAIGQALFKHWFMEFEFPNEKGKPYKSSGRKMVDSEFGEIPEGWRVGKIEDIASDEKNAIVDGPFGTQMKVKEYQEEGIPVIEMEYLEGYPFYKPFKHFISEAKFQEVKRSSVKKGDIVISKTGTLGLLGIMTDIYDKAVLVSRLAKITIDEKKISRYYLFLLLKRLSFEKYWDHISSGSTMPIINLTHIKSKEILIPNEDILNKFEALMSSFYATIHNNLKEVQNLFRLRDSLLPKLMSGQLRAGMGK